MRMSTLPPSWMSVPRPAMLVAMVTAPEAAGLGDDVRLLLVVAGVQHAVRDLPASSAGAASISDFSIDTVPTSTGWPRLWHSSISSTMASYFSRAVR